jgi:hypothetical protein
MSLLDTEGDFPPDMKALFDAISSIKLPASARFVLGMRRQYHHPTRHANEARPNLIRILARVRAGREATNPKDRIWALLGLASNQGALRITPDYTDYVSDTLAYCNATKAMLSAGHVDILAFSQWIKSGDADPLMPSWAPDWRMEVKQPFGQLPWDTPYSASRYVPFPRSLDHAVSTHHLKLKGTTVDYIESIKPQCNNGEWLSMANRREALTYLLDIRSLCQISNTKLEESGAEIYADPLCEKQHINVFR